MDDTPDSSKGVTLNANNDATVGGDVVGHDKVVHITQNYYQAQDSVANSQAYALTVSATTPGLILFLMDGGFHTNKVINDRPAYEIITEALHAALQTLTQRSTRGSQVVRRYYIGCYRYSLTFEDILGGLKSITEVAQQPLPILRSSNDSSDTFGAFVKIEGVLRREISRFQNCPAPLVCHITAGEYLCPDPKPIVDRIKALQVRDGPVLVENVLIDDEALLMPAGKPHHWTGVHDSSDLSNAFARQLFDMSSHLPEQYRQYASEIGYNLGPGTRMLYPGTRPEIVNLGLGLVAASTISR